MWLAVHCIRL